MTQMTPRSRLGLQLLMLLAGVLVGLAIIALHCARLSLYLARPKLLSGDVARELVWLNLPFAATVLGLLAVRTRTVVAPLVGVTLGIIAGSFIAAAVPEAHLLPLPRGLLSAPVTLACAIAFLAIMIGIASTAAWIDRGQGLSWLNYGAAAGDRFFLCPCYDVFAHSRPPSWRRSPVGRHWHFRSFFVWPFCGGIGRRRRCDLGGDVCRPSWASHLH